MAWPGSSGAINAARATTPHGYTGHEMLDAVGLVHMNGRVYDPYLGRMTSADPVFPLKVSSLATSELDSYSLVAKQVSVVLSIAFNPTSNETSSTIVHSKVDEQHGVGLLNSQTLNRFSYVVNRPLALVDPSGFEAVTFIPLSADLFGWGDGRPRHVDGGGAGGGSGGGSRGGSSMGRAETFGAAAATVGSVLGAMAMYHPIPRTAGLIAGVVGLHEVGAGALFGATLFGSFGLAIGGISEYIDQLEGQETADDDGGG